MHARRAAERDARKVLNEEAKVLKAKLSKTATVDAIVTVGAPASEIAKCAASTRAELIVMGRGGGRTIRDIFLGSTAERVIRRAQRPVLAVWLRPRAAYRRPALALAVDDAADAAVAALLRLIPPPRGRLAVIHAYDVPYYGLIHGGVSEDAMEHLHDEFRQDGIREVAKVLLTAFTRAKIAPRDAPSWTAHVRYGSPRTVILREVRKMDTDVLVLGTRGHTGAAYAFLGSVAGDLLRDVACDALVVPPRRNRSR
jgi:nucleotide-binding universal stress UspA family protein